MKTILLLVCTLIVPALSQYSYDIEKPGTARRAGESNEFKISVKNHGKVVYSVERALPFDVPYPLITLNEQTGTLVLRYVFDGFAEIYDKDGIKRWEHSFFKEEGPNYERTIAAAIGVSSLYFLLSDAHREKAAVQKFSMEGALQWSVTLPHQYAYDIAISDDEQTIVAGSYLALEDEVRRSAALMTSEGEIEGTVDVLFRKALFSSDQKFLALQSEREVVVVDMSLKKEIARTAKQTAGIITDIIWDDEELIVQESEVVTPKEGRYFFLNPVCMRYSSSLQNIRTIRFPGISFTVSSLQRVDGMIRLNLDSGANILPVQ